MKDDVDPGVSLESVMAGSDAAFIIEYSDLMFGRCIGAGAFSKVFYGWLRGSGSAVRDLPVPVAIKALKASPDLLDLVQKELEVLRYEGPHA